MSSEKVMVALNQLNAAKLNAALARQIDKRAAAGRPSEAAAQGHLAVVTSTPGFDADDFFAMWDKYYPTIVSLLGFASWFIPGKAVTIIKALLAVINNQVIPVLKDALKE